MRAGCAAMLLLSASLIYLGAASIELDASECRDVACATGYTGTAGVSCATDGEFDLTNCVPMCVRPTTTTGYIITSCDTTNGAISASSCNLGATCDTGYRTTGSGPTATCSAPFGTFSFTGCEAIPKCTLPTSTTGYDVTNCAATSTNLLTEAQCAVTCATDYGVTAVPSCASEGAAFTFSGCTNECTLPTDTTGYITTGCTGTKTSAQCTVTCDTTNEYTGTNPTDACNTPGGTHSLSGCTLNPKCSLPSDTTGYSVGSCSATSPTTIFASACTVSCDTGNSYGPDGTGITDTCSTDGGTFALSGCAPSCTLPTDTTGYITTGCTGSQTSDQCTLACNTAADYIGSATDSCSTAGGTHAISGCVLPKCTLPSATTGYDVTSCDTSASSLTKSQCSVTCATNWAGSPADDCTADGGTFALTGCARQCAAPSTVPAGYVVTSCSGTILATQCSVSCDTANDYEGNAVVACDTAGGTFSYSGCTPKPKCTLPSTAVGYDTTNCNTGRGSSYGIFASQCSLGCADGYTGSPSATCSSSGGTFELTGCARADTCTLPTSTTGYTTDRCDTVSGCSAPAIDTASCSVECDVGYTGTGTDACSTDGGDFTLGGCVPMCVVPATTTGYDTTLCDTTNAAITEAQCTVSCASGYRSTGSGPSDACSAGFGTFSFTGCEAIPKCTLPTSTTGYDTSSCTASATSQLTEAQCTVSCDTTNGYGPAGTATDSCASEGAAFVFSGCKPMCTATATTGYDISTCTGSRTEDQCSVTCDTANEYTGTNPTETCDTANGNFAFSGCTLNPKCNLPTDTTGFVTTSCDTSTNSLFASQCTVSCDTSANYGPSGTATDTCSTDGGDFQLTGCSPMCELAASTPGYIRTSCGGFMTSSQCSVSCDTANEYSGTNPTDSCSTAGGEHSLSGCTLNPKCTLPTSTPGYLTTGCDTSGGAIFASACVTTCDTANNYAGTPVDTCATDNGVFTLSGCDPQCTLPTTTTGYTISGCSGTTLASQCTVGCASGYTGNAGIECPAAGGVHQLTGCSAIPKCTLAAPTAGYTTTSCNPGRVDAYGITAAQCSVSCAAGYTGSATAACSTEGGTFALDGCTRMNLCTLPSDTTGYKTTWCDASGWTEPSSCSGGTVTVTADPNGTTAASSEPDFAVSIRQCPLLMLACTYLALRFVQ